MKLRYKACSQYRTFYLLCLSQTCMELFIKVFLAASSDNFNLVQSYLVTYKKKVEVAVADNEFLHKKIYNKDALWIVVLRCHIPEISVKHDRDLTALTSVTKNKVYNVKEVVFVYQDLLL